MEGATSGPRPLGLLADWELQFHKNREPLTDKELLDLRLTEMILARERGEVPGFHDNRIFCESKGLINLTAGEILNSFTGNTALGIAFILEAEFAMEPTQRHFQEEFISRYARYCCDGISNEEIWHLEVVLSPCLSHYLLELMSVF